MVDRAGRRSLYGLSNIRDGPVPFWCTIIDATCAGGRSEGMEKQDIAEERDESGPIRKARAEFADAMAKHAAPPKPPPPVTAAEQGVGVPRLQSETASGLANPVDALHRAELARQLAGMLASSEQQTPLTIGVFGPWGSGKSTFMALMREELANDGSPFLFADFNAWAYEATDNLAAGLAQETVNALRRDLGLLGRFILKARFGLARNRSSLASLVLRSVLAASATAGAVVALTSGALLPASGFLRWAATTGLALIAGLVPFAGKLRSLISHPLATEWASYLRLPDYDKHLGLLPVLQSDISTLCKLRLNDEQSLVVIVDDLDRCSTKGVRATLEAVRLVMDVPRVVVVIAIDPRVAIGALAEQYKGLADPSRTAEDVARDYLGKIIQVPIQLPAPDRNAVVEYVRSALFTKMQLGRDVSVEQKARRDRAKGRPVNREAMVETREEVDRFAELALEFGFTNPRQLRRLRNSYQLLKAIRSSQADGVRQAAQSDALLGALFCREYVDSLPSCKRNPATGGAMHLVPKRALTTMKAACTEDEIAAHLDLAAAVTLPPALAHDDADGAKGGGGQQN